MNQQFSKVAETWEEEYSVRVFNPKTKTFTPVNFNDTRGIAIPQRNSLLDPAKIAEAQAAHDWITEQFAMAHNR
jgi:hypothetical protein